MRFVFLVLLVALAPACRSKGDALPGDLALAESSAAAPATELGVRVVLSRSELRVGTETLGKFTALGPAGFDASWKKDGDPKQLLLKETFQVLQHHKTQADAAWGDATLYVDSSTPQRAVIELLYTLGQAEISRWHFVVMSAGKRASLDFETPSVGEIAQVEPRDAPGSLAALGSPRGGSPAQPMIVHIDVTDRTIVLKGADGPCAAVRTGDAYDFGRVTSCARAAAAAGGEASSRWAFLAAAPATPLQTVVRTIDAVHDSFPKVAFTVRSDAGD